ncbi:MAG: tRNA (guanosine(37)-N1)-methyltransferase TrmD [Acidobacteriota bacterium]
MRIDIVTIFPAFFAGPLDHGMVRRARERGQLAVTVHDLRDHATDRHRSVDDAPFAGDGGMILRVEPLVAALRSIRAADPARHPAVLVLSPQGEPLDQRMVETLARREGLVLVCGRYEGIDARVAEIAGALEISVGDFVLSGGELAACVVVEAVTRLLPGVLGCDRSAAEDSFATGILDFPQYTRPAAFEGHDVPEVLLSGDHAKVRRFRKKQALLGTLRRRPDLLLRASLDAEAREILEELRVEVSAAPGAPRP